jgi:tRNA A-37 threonylcarbamoyl transferase component Bud32
MISSSVQVYNLVVDLHRIGIVHRDLEPWNVARVHGGGFRLIDFTESGKHHCKESKVQFMIISSQLLLTELAGERQAADPIQKPKCYELQTLRRLLWNQQPLQTDGG